MIDRRDLLRSAVAAIAAVPLGAAAQPGLPIIGYLTSRSAVADTALRTPFLEGLKQAGFVVGRNVAIEYRVAEGQPDRLPALAAELVRLPPAVLVVSTYPRQWRQSRRRRPLLSCSALAVTPWSSASSQASADRPATPPE